MSLTELAPSLHALPRAEKLIALQLLSADLAQGDIPALVPGGEYAVYTPEVEASAADTLLRLLKANQCA